MFAEIPFEIGSIHTLLVCSECGFIAEDIVDHNCPTLNPCCDWWHIRVKVLKNKEEDKNDY